MFRDKQKHPEDYEIPPKKKKRRRRSNDHPPPLTAWTWWMYAEKTQAASLTPNGDVNIPKEEDENDHKIKIQHFSAFF